MTAAERLDIAYHFAALEDPRDERFITHPLDEVLTVALCAMLSGAESFGDIAAFGRAKESWLRSLGLALPGGVPSHDTFRDVFRHLSPDAFGDCFAAWVGACCGRLGLGHVRVDGKSLRGSRGPAGTCLHLVSAWAGGLTLAQVACEDKSNEITAIPRLLGLLALEGAVVSIDALGCQKDIAGQVIEQGGDYVLQVKDNQPRLLEDVLDCVAGHLEQQDTPPCAVEVDRGHGRSERRTCWVVNGPEGIRDEALWPGLAAVCFVVRERTTAAGTSSEAAYFIGSRAGTPQEYAAWVRGHWAIENKLHWVLDVTFGEDGCRLKDRNAAQNLAALRRVALALLRRDQSKGSIKGKLRRAAWDDDFRRHLLNLLSGESP
jgi:predicted transposase YbfD/YdcC